MLRKNELDQDMILQLIVDGMVISMARDAWALLVRNAQRDGRLDPTADPNTYINLSELKIYQIFNLLPTLLSYQLLNDDCVKILNNEKSRKMLNRFLPIIFFYKEMNPEYFKILMTSLFSKLKNPEQFSTLLKRIGEQHLIAILRCPGNDLSAMLDVLNALDVRIPQNEKDKFIEAGLFFCKYADKTSSTSGVSEAEVFVNVYRREAMFNFINKLPLDKSITALETAKKEDSVLHELFAYRNSLTAKDYFPIIDKLLTEKKKQFEKEKLMAETKKQKGFEQGHADQATKNKYYAAEAGRVRETINQLKKELEQIDSERLRQEIKELDGEMKVDSNNNNVDAKAELSHLRTVFNKLNEFKTLIEILSSTNKFSASPETNIEKILREPGCIRLVLILADDLTQDRLNKVTDPEFVKKMKDKEITKAQLLASTDAKLPQVLSLFKPSGAKGQGKQDIEMVEKRSDNTLR